MDPSLRPLGFQFAQDAVDLVLFFHLGEAVFHARAIDGEQLSLGLAYGFLALEQERIKQTRPRPGKKGVPSR